MNPPAAKPLCRVHAWVSPAVLATLLTAKIASETAEHGDEELKPVDGLCLVAFDLPSDRLASANVARFGFVIRKKGYTALHLYLTVFLTISVRSRCGFFRDS